MIFGCKTTVDEMKYLAKKVFCFRLIVRTEALWENNKYKYPNEFNDLMIQCFNPDNLPEPLGWGCSKDYGMYCAKVACYVKGL